MTSSSGPVEKPGFQCCIHQIWAQGLNHFRETQPEFYKYSLLWKDQYPDFDYHLWSEEEYLPRIAAYSPALLKAYEAAPSFPAKSDIARYVLLHTCEYDKNWYVDTDYRSFKRCDYLFRDDNIDLVLVGMHLTPNKLLFGNYKYSNAWIVSKPGTVYMSTLLDRIATMPYDKAKYTKFEWTWTVSGPKGLSQVVEQYKWEQIPAIRILPHSLVELSDFSNLSLCYQSKEEILDRYPWATGIHLCAGSWIENAQGLKASFGRFYNWVTNWSDFIHIGLLIAPLLILLGVLLIWRLSVYHRRQHPPSHTHT
jgi:hypothetical protein